MFRRWKRNVASAMAALMVVSSAQMLPPMSVEAKGGLAATDFSATGFPTVSGNNGRIAGQNILSDFNTSFEGAGDNGIYWWNDANWSQAGLVQKEHSGLAISDTAGSYYVEVLAAEETSKGICQIMSDGIPSLMQQGATYGYSYFAKNAQGATGDIKFTLASMTSSYSNYTEPSLVRDQEVTFSDSVWKQVTGTFVMTDPQDMVKLEFSGAEGQNFCVDDLQIVLLDAAPNEERVITNNILASYNTDFEGAGENGLYWWNDANWSATDIPQMQHPAEKPFGTSGNNYVQVNGGLMQLGLGDSSDFFVEGGIYEYTYYAKLAEGATAGYADLQLVSMNASYGDQITVNLLPDSFFEVSDSQWTKITGEFMMVDPQAQMQIRFVGDGENAFCIDDFRIGLVSAPIELGEEIIVNGNFDNEDLSMWMAEANGATVTLGAETEDIADSGVKSYGKILGRTNQYQCMAQDITDRVEKGAEYQVTFYAKLDEADYAQVEEALRTVSFGPYIVDGGGTNYLGAAYSSELSGDLEKSIEAGVWTKFTGSFKIPKTSDISKIVIRLLEQNGELGSYSITGVSMKKVEKEEGELPIERDIPNWKDAITGALGEDTIAAAAVMQSEINDEALMALVTKHFNAVTFGNELKPDSLFGYNNAACNNRQTVEFKGQEMEVPVMDFSRPDRIANEILAWNEEHPEAKIRIRGHVLVWHSQTPEWFFHEGYDKTAPYVDKDTMNLRLEWYIASVFDHFFGPEANGKYDGLFYGWDVVNEAISDATATYRSYNENPSESLSNDTHGSNSSWWKVYESNEFIINAFRYANKYAPSNVELYYNDYNETDSRKSEGIATLLRAVKEAEGTRIDAMGMQAHYNVTGFSATQFKAAAEKYGAIVGKIQLTELDFKASNGYNGSDAAKEAEYAKMAACHKQVFDVLKEIDAADNNINVSGITVWGVIEPNSWLHTQSGVGGGANGSKQCPLLFDGNYKAKPAFWAYVDESMLAPAIQKIVISEVQDGKVEGKSYSLAVEDAQVSFTPVWTMNGVKVQVTAPESFGTKEGEIAIYVNQDKAEFAPASGKKAISEGVVKDGMWTTELEVAASSLAVSKVIYFDMAVTVGGKTYSFNDTTNNQEISAKYYAEAVLKPGVVTIVEGTPVIDGDADEAYEEAMTIPLQINNGSNVTARAKLLWDAQNLYVFANVADAVLNKDSGDDYQQDSLEVFIDENNHKTAAYDEDDKQYRINYANDHSFNGTKCIEENVESAVKLTEDGYVVEAAFKWTDITPADGTKIGLELQINDANETGVRVGTLSWYDETGMGWSGSDVYGEAVLVATHKEPTPDPIPDPDPTPDPTPDPDPTPVHTHVAAATWKNDGVSHWQVCKEGDGAILNKANHKWDAGKVTVAPTCSKAGTKVYTCSVCKRTKTETVSPTGKHSYDAGKITVAPTCGKAGVKTFTCTVCNKTKTETVAATKQHSYVEKIEKARNYKDGKSVKTCSTCGKVVTKKIYRIKSVKLASKKYVYNKKNITPAVTAKDRKGNVLVEGTDYTVSYSKNQLPGQAVAKVTFCGKYKGSATLVFKIVPKKPTLTIKAKEKSIEYKISKDSKATGYSVEYSTEPSFKASKTIKISIDGYKKNAGIIKKLEKGTKYYVRVRSYKKIGVANYYSAYSKVASLKVK